ncbi:hypothetical protein Q1695_006367 [Nippostrongylus brasiliensis]|nr:hypothetical protein Q1695_006367 [Nippostrongylus brasiliensis]
MRSVIVRKCNELRQSHSRRPTSVVVQELVQEVAGREFDDYSAPERYNIRRGQADVIPGALNPSHCRCAVDREEFNPHDRDGVIYIASHTFPLLYAFLPDATEESYLNLFRWFRAQVEPLGGVPASEPSQCNCITDFEMPSINAVRSTLNVNYYRCFFHYN